jgi:hypothetical protein
MLLNKKIVNLFSERAKNQESRVKNFIFNLSSYFLLLTSFLFSINSQAQCAMCRASLEGEGNVAKAQAVNDGIVYLMVIPYLLAAVVAVIIYRMYKRRK